MKKQEKTTKYSFWIFLAVWIGLWAIPACFTDSLILPGPAETLKALLTLACTKRFWLDILWTLLRCISGVVISFALGTLCATISHRNDYFRDFIRIPVSFFKSVPVMAIIIYVILIARSNWVAIIVCLLMCFPIAYTNILSGLDSFKREYLELAKVNGLNKNETFNLIYRPALQPSVSSALSLITGMSFKVVVAAEILSIPDYSIGYEMMNAKYYLETPNLFAYIIVLIVLSLIMETLVKKATSPKTSDLHSFVCDGIMRVEKIQEPDKSVSEIVVLERVFKKYGDDIKVLEDYSEKFNKEITAVLAPSGRGKTTLARLISGLERPDSGKVYLHTDKISYLFQDDRLLPWLNVYDNMALGLIGMGVKDCDDKIRKMAHQLEIEDVLEMKPSELSGGMAHRVAIGRAVLRNAGLIILDEPFRGLDEALKERIIDRIWEPLTKDRAVILITHDMKFMEETAGRIIELV